jgi:hypothetical protein
VPLILRDTQLTDSGLTHAVVAFDARYKRVVSLLVSAWEASKAKELYDLATPAAPVRSVAAIEHLRGRRVREMCCPDQGEKPEVKTIILEDNAVALRAAELWARRTESNVRSGTWTW